MSVYKQYEQTHIFEPWKNNSWYVINININIEQHKFPGRKKREK